MQEMSIPMSADEVSLKFQSIGASRKSTEPPEPEPEASPEPGTVSEDGLIEWYIAQKKESWLRGKVGSFAQLRLRLTNWWQQNVRGQVIPSRPFVMPTDAS